MLRVVFLFMRDVVRTFVSFLSLLDTLSLVHWSCDHLVIANIVFIFDIYLMMLLSHFHLSLHVLFLSLFIHMFLILHAIFYLCFTLRCCDEFCLKCFKNTSCKNLPCHELSSCKVFSRVCVRVYFIAN